MNSGMKIEIDNLKKVLEVMREFETTDVMIGVPAEAAGREDGPLTSAEIGYIHEHGSDAAGIDPRPFLGPGIDAVLPEVTELLKEGASAALDGNAGAMRRSLARAGQIAAYSVKNQFDNNHWKPLSDAALRSRAYRHKYLKKRKNLQKKVQPLVDTGRLKNSITYVLKRVK